MIHIYEADFNALLAIKWQQLLHFADGHGLLNNGQNGGRPGSRKIPARKWFVRRAIIMMLEQVFLYFRLVPCYVVSQPWAFIGQFLSTLFFLLLLLDTIVILVCQSFRVLRPKRPRVFSLVPRFLP